MKDVVYPYDKALYGRHFLNCYQRQSLVMLAPTVPNLHLLFHRCLVSTDLILEHTIREQIPKYDFACGFFDAGDLLRIGVAAENLPVDTYAEGRKLLADAVAAEGFALPVVDVFYYPHCAEYRNAHVVHTVTLTGFDDGTGEWSVVDDNKASVLCRYRYADDVIAASFDNNAVRRVRFFGRRPSDAGLAQRQTADEFRALVAGHRDELLLFTAIGDILASRWLSRQRVLTGLHDALSLYLGSRTCLHAYLVNAFPGAGEGLGRAVDAAVQRTGEVLGMLRLATITGRLDAAAVVTAAGEIRDAELALVRGIRELT